MKKLLSVWMIGGFSLFLYGYEWAVRPTENQAVYSLRTESVNTPLQEKFYGLENETPYMFRLKEGEVATDFKKQDSITGENGLTITRYEADNGKVLLKKTVNNQPLSIQFEDSKGNLVYEETDQSKNDDSSKNLKSIALGTAPKFDTKTGASLDKKSFNETQQEQRKGALQNIYNTLYNPDWSQFLKENNMTQKQELQQQRDKAANSDIKALYDYAMNHLVDDVNLMKLDNISQQNAQQSVYDPITGMPISPQARYQQYAVWKVDNEIQSLQQAWQDLQRNNIFDVRQKYLNMKTTVDKTIAEFQAQKPQRFADQKSFLVKLNQLRQQVGQIDQAYQNFPVDQGSQIQQTFLSFVPGL
jgi:hypothetical protein